MSKELEALRWVKRCSKYNPSANLTREDLSVTHLPIHEIYKNHDKAKEYYDLIKQALQAQVSDSEVKELFEWFRDIKSTLLDTPYIRQTKHTIVLHKNIFNERLDVAQENLDHLKNKFAQMERENKQYKQLLDEVELFPEDEENYQHYNVKGEKSRMDNKLYNILKQLKSIGSDKNE